MDSSERSPLNKIEESLMNDLLFDQVREVLNCIHNHKDIEHILKARDILWDTRKDLLDLCEDHVEIHDNKDYRTLTDIEQTLIYMIDHEKCYGDDYTAAVLKDLKNKYW